MCLKWQSKLSKREDISLLFIPLLNSLQLVEQRSGFGLSESSFPWQVTVWGKHKTNREGEKKKKLLSDCGRRCTHFSLAVRSSVKKKESVLWIRFSSPPSDALRKQVALRAAADGSASPEEVDQKEKNLPQMLFILFLLFFASTWSSLETVTLSGTERQKKTYFLCAGHLSKPPTM